VGALAATLAAILAGCATVQRTGAPHAAGCVREARHQPYTPAAFAGALAGDYAFTIVADSGERRGRHASGSLTIRDVDDSLRRQRPGVPQFQGEARLAFDSIGIRVVRPVGDAGSPIYSSFVGDGERSPVQMLLGPVYTDGPTTHFVINRFGAQGFAGVWWHSFGAFGRTATGWFCATRRPAA